MDGQVTARTLVCAIPKAVIVSWVTKRLEKMGKVLIKTIEDFVNAEVAPANTHQLECNVEERVRELARSLTDWSFNSLEPKRMEAMPTRIEHRGDTYRKLNNKTPHSRILTRFGNITSVATLSVYADGKRTGADYRSAAPEENQASLSKNFTSLLKVIIQSRGDQTEWHRVRQRRRKN